MTAAVAMAELVRGDMVESVHHGHAVICDDRGGIVEAWGDLGTVIFPRSSCKMIQALPLVESGAAAGLGDAQLALACASHQGQPAHVGLVSRWLGDLGLGDADLRCGTHMPYDEASRNALIREHASPCQMHNNCSGKHTGFLTLNRHLGGGAEYVETDHPVQRAVKAAFEEVTNEPSPGHMTDGCSAPNFATSVAGLARAMGFFAGAREGGGARADAAARLVGAMTAHPDLVAGDGRACTELMEAMGGRVAIKTGAEGVFVAILPEARRGVALKILDGNARGAEAAIAALLVRLGALDPDHPATRKRLGTQERNRRGMVTGSLRAAPGFPGPR